MFWTHFIRLYILLYTLKFFRQTFEEMIVAKKCFQLLKPFFLLIIFLTSSNNNASNEKRVATSDVQIDVDQSEWADPLDPLKGYTSLQVGQGRPDNFHCDCSHQIAQMKTVFFALYNLQLYYYI